MTLTNDFLHTLMLKAISKTFVRKRKILQGTWDHEKTVVLSFDCDYDRDMKSVANILETLKINKVPASFALVGRLVEQFPDVPKAIAAEGHEIINHTTTHPPEFRKLPPEQKLEEITKFQSLMKDSYGINVKGFRAPHLRHGKQTDLFEILRNLSMFDSSLLGFGVHNLGNVTEIPLTPFPDIKNLPFCTYHHFRMPLLSSTKQAFMKRWEKLLAEQKFINVYLDPLDIAASPQLLTDMIRLGSENGFSFKTLQDIWAIAN